VWSAALQAVVRQRLAAADRPALDHATRLLSRAILRSARRAARRRDTALLTQLDAALTRVRSGLPAGLERLLADIIRGGLDPAALSRWLTTPPNHDARAPAVRMAAALIGVPG